MKRVHICFVVALGLTACGGSAPFGDDSSTDDETTTDTGGIPAELASDLESFTFNPTSETLTIRGISLEDGAFEDTYRRRPGLDRGDYQAYTAQAGSLDRHSTAYVRDVRGTQAAVAVTGGQFTFFFAGGAYGNESFTAPAEPGSQTEGGLVTYAGNYVGLLNIEGSGEDLLPVDPNTPESLRPVQAAEITGTILINASFSDAVVNGTITDRVIVDAPDIDVEDLDLAPTDIASDGTFFGDSSVALQTRGEYGGIFGGDGATEVAGIVHAEEHIGALTNEEEFGVFVLAQCGTEGDDPLCDQPVP